MPNFQEHWRQANSNLVFLSKINQQIPSCWDWQVTVCFYVAVHLVNAHLSKFDLHYRSHSAVDVAINPFKELSVSKIPKDVYFAYSALQTLSRRSRYLVSDNNSKVDVNACPTQEKHFARAIKHLNVLAVYFCDFYQESLPQVSIACAKLTKGDSLKPFHVV